MKQPPQCFVSDLVKAVEAIAPARLAESWDNVGLQVGHPGAPLRRVLTCLEVSPPILAEAVRLKADAIVAHHPLIFQPLSALNLAQPAGDLVATLIRENIALVVAHTNLDSAAWGTNAALAEACGLRPEGPLLSREGELEYQFVIFTPKGHESAMIEAIERGGGARIGGYNRCTYRVAGTGTFMGGQGTHPAIGEPGKFEEVEEYRLEARVPDGARAAVLREALLAHPYEEPAFFYHAIKEEGGKAGMGCVAWLDPQRPAEDLAAELKTRLGLAAVRLSGPPKKKVKKVALCSGSGGSFIGKVAGKAEAYITGEINYHQAVEAHARGIAVIELGHFESEVLVARPLAEKLAGVKKFNDAGVEILAAKSDLQPFRYL